jgi:protein-S-isoprenylcysteine O-methyltransferase Ste14
MTLALYWLSTQYNWGLDVRLPTIGLSWITGGGFVLLTLGLAMTAWGRASINGLWGANIYSYPSNDDYLVREHAYNLIRHPIYLGQILMAWGTFCVAVNWIFLALPVLVTVFAIVRARNEEKYLLQRFNQTYIEYRDKTNFMLPL